MKLSETHIQELHNFCRKRLVKHYDLQTELVDHLANGIEQQWKKDSNIDFSTALQKEFRKFGHFGFRGVLRARKKVIQKKYNSLILDEFKSYFTWPKILSLVVFYMFFLLFLRLLPMQYKWLFVSLFILPIGAYFMYFSYKAQKAYRAKIGIEKRWMLQEKLYAIGGAGVSMLNLFHVFNFLYIMKISTNSTLADVLITFLVVVSITLCYIIIIILPKRAEEILSKEYPEYQMVSKRWR